MNTFYSALNDPLRRLLLAMLQTAGELCVCELVTGVHESQPKVSRHLSVLRDAGVVRVRREGLWMHYAISDDLPAWQVDTIAALCVGGVPEADVRAALSRKQKALCPP